MKPCISFFRTIPHPFSRPLQALILSCAFTGPLAAQTNYYWDTNTTAGITTGSGTWATSSALNWNDSLGTLNANTNWANGNDIANISGNTQTITVNEAIGLSQLNVTGTGNVFSGTGSLDFGTNAGVINHANSISTFSIGLAGTNGITKSGAGAFTYTGTGTYTGSLTTSGGVFTLGNTTATINRLYSASGLVIGSANTAGTFTMAAATGGTNAQTFTNLGVGIGLNTLASSGASAPNMASVTFGGNYTRSNNGILGFTNATGYSVTANFANTGEHIIDGILVGVNRSNNTFVANNNTANGAPTSTTTTSGTVNTLWTSGTHLVSANNNTVAYTGTTASLRLSGGRTVTLGSGAIINTGMIANNGGSATGLITGGTITSGNGRDLILIGGDSAYRTEIASQIVNNGLTSIGLLVANAGGANGNLISGDNTYTGNTTLVSQLTIAGHNNAFGTTGNIIFAGGNLAGSIGSNRVLSNNISMLVNGGLNVLNQGGASPFGGAGTSYDLTLAGNISGAGNLSLNNSVGGNKVTLSGNNSAHTGTVVVNNAATTLALGSAYAIGTGVNLATAGTVTSSDTTARSFTVSNYPSAGGTFGQAGTGDLNVTLPTLGASAYNINVGNSLTTIVNTTLGTGSGATLAKNGAGTLALAGTFGLFSNLNSGLTLNAGAIQYGTGGTTGFLDMTGVNAVINGTAAGTKVIFNRSNELSVAVPLTGSLGVEQIGAGVTTLTKTNTYSGTTAVNAGTLKIDTAGSIANSTGVTVAAGAKLIYNSSTTLNVGPVLNGSGISNRAILAGTGTINATLTLDNLGDTLSPGNSPGILPVTGNQDWASFGYDWEINDFSAATGTTPGGDFDQIAIAGSLDLSGGANSYILKILSLDALNVSGDVPNFSEINRSWTILTTTGGITGFAKTDWVINAGGFTNLETGAFSLDVTGGNNLVLSYTIIPEPRAALLGGLGILALLRRRRQ